MNLGEFHDLVSNALHRGTALDSVIPTRVRQAVSWIERNYSYQYMKRWLTGTIDVSVTYPYIIPIYELRIKSIEAVRLESSDGWLNDLKRIDPKERSQLPEEGTPSAYWLDGETSLILDAYPATNTEYALHVVQYTAWPTDENFEHWLIDNAEDMLLFTTLWYTAIHLRDSRMANDYKILRDEAQQTLHSAQQDIQHNDRDAALLYSPPFEWPVIVEEDQDV